MPGGTKAVPMPMTGRPVHASVIDMTSDRLPEQAGAESLIGAWKRFGPTGPAYQIVGFGRLDPAGAQTMRVHVAETGEEAEIRLADIRDDPTA